MLYDQPRAASINAARTTYFATIHKDDYVAYVKRFEKKQKEQMVDFFKQIPFLKSLSTQTIVKIQLNFIPHKMAKSG